MLLTAGYMLLNVVDSWLYLVDVVDRYMLLNVVDCRLHVVEC